MLRFYRKEYKFNGKKVKKICNTLFDIIQIHKFKMHHVIDLIYHSVREMHALLFVQYISLEKFEVNTNIS